MKHLRTVTPTCVSRILNNVRVCTVYVFKNKGSHVLSEADTL